MVIVETKMKDILRGRPDQEVVVRLDFADVAELSCHCDYDPALCGKGENGGNGVNLMRKIEVREDDGSWQLYPSVAWLDGVFSDEQLQTIAVVKIGDDKGFSIMSSFDGVPDGTLMVAAEEAGIHTETIG